VLGCCELLLACAAITLGLPGVDIISSARNSHCHLWLRFCRRTAKISFTLCNASLPPVAALLLSHHKHHLASCRPQRHRCRAAAVLPQVSREHLGGKLKQANGPTWQQLWQLLQALTAKQQQQGAVGQTAGQTAGQTTAIDATALFDQYLREAEAVPLTPPPYPGELVARAFVSLCEMLPGILCRVVSLTLDHVCWPATHATTLPRCAADC
jgi:hypothetical protein